MCKFVRLPYFRQMSFFVYGFFLILLYSTFCHCRRCFSVTKDGEPEYFLVAMCHRSKHSAISVANYNSLEKCKGLALVRKAMAFNFSPPTRNSFRNTNSRDGLKSCMIFSCPEVENSTSLTPDSRFDYYSTYADPIPPVNSTCIEGMGVFVVHLLKDNYTNAKTKCHEYGAEFPDIASESRTNKLSQILEISLPNNGPQQAYIGMDDLDSEAEFIRSNGELLTCTTFRAWAPGYPKRRHPGQSCCTLGPTKMWRVINCEEKLPFVCEIFPRGWYQDYSMYEPIACLNRGSDNG